MLAVEKDPDDVHVDNPLFDLRFQMKNTIKPRITVTKAPPRALATIIQTLI